MSSKTANEKHFDGLKDYPAVKDAQCLYRPEVPMNTIQNVLGGVRSTLTYVGAINQTTSKVYNVY